MVDAQPLIDALADAGMRSTEPRRAVAELIAARGGHFTARELVDDAAERRLAIGRATVFRALETFADLGLVERLDLPSGEHAYVACEPAHHHHVVCSRCGRSTEVEDSGMSDVVREVARRTGYRIERHRVELFGICPECQGAGAGSE
jgi:Fur family transcriptional regulator, ferric uptake regulator